MLLPVLSCIDIPAIIGQTILPVTLPEEFHRDVANSSHFLDCRNWLRQGKDVSVVKYHASDFDSSCCRICFCHRGFEYYKASADSIVLFNCPQAAYMSRPRGRRINAGTPAPINMF
jgi:hypothetical protein